MPDSAARRLGGSVNETAQEREGRPDEAQSSSQTTESRALARALQRVNTSEKLGHSATRDYDFATGKCGFSAKAYRIFGLDSDGPITGVGIAEAELDAIFEEF